MKKSVLVLALVVALVLAACGGSTSTVAKSSSSNKIHRGGTLNLLCASPATSMDPPESEAGPDCDEWDYGLMYDSLLQTDDLGNFHPDVATKYTITDGGTVYTFDIRHDIKFTDGTQLNAAAVKFSLDRYQSILTSSLATYLKGATIATDGNWTVKVTVPQANSVLLNELAGADIVSPAAAKRWGSAFTLHGGGSGPFELKSWSPGGVATFVRNPHYWKKGADGKPLPYLNEVTVQAQTDSSVAMLDLKGGTANYDGNVGTTDLATAQADPNLTIETTNLIQPQMLVMNATKTPFNNLDLRLAVQAALNRSAVLKDISFGQGYLSPTPAAKQAPYYASKPSPVYNLQRAKKYLTEAGYPSGLPVTMTVIDRTPDTQIAQIVQSQLAKVGIKVNIQILDRTTWVNLWEAHQGEMGLLRTGGSSSTPAALTTGDFDPRNSADFSGLQDSTMTSLLTELDATSNKAQEKTLYAKITAELVKTAPYVVFGDLTVAAAQQKNVHGVDQTLYHAADAWLGASSS